MEQKKPSLVLKLWEINLLFFGFAPPPPPFRSLFFSLKFHIWGYPPLDQKQVVLKGGGSKLHCTLFLPESSPISLLNNT